MRVVLGRDNHLGGLLANLLTNSIDAAIEQLGRIRLLWPSRGALRQQIIKLRQDRAWRRRPCDGFALKITVEATPLAGVACWAERLREHQQRIPIAILTQLDQP